MRWIYREAYGSRQQPVTDTISFSACVTHREVVFHVHWYCAADERNIMSWIATCETMRDVQRSNHIVNNIFDHCLGPRQTKVRDALALLFPIPEYWKLARPADSMDDSQTPGGEEDQTAGSHKTPRIG